VVLESNFHIDGGRAAGAKLFEMQDRPTAVFAANDLMAHGILSFAHSNNKRIPQDLSVVGLDDIWFAAETAPPLTTVSLPRQEIGSMAVRTLFDLLNHPKAEPGSRRFTVLTDLVIRESTCVPPEPG
jgi:LacI family transcriptional regulator